MLDSDDDGYDDDDSTTGHTRAYTGLRTHLRRFCQTMPCCCQLPAIHSAATRILQTMDLTLISDLSSLHPPWTLFFLPQSSTCLAWLD